MDIFLINILVGFSCLIFGYFFGSIPTAVWIGKSIFKQDPRNFGSGNAGAANASRLWGKKIGIIVATIDIIKTISPIWICWAILTFIPFNGSPLMPTTMQFINDDISSFYIQFPIYWLAPIGGLFGHCFSIFANFKGGKGAAATLGTGMATSWFFGFVPGTLYLILLKKTRYVSLTSIICGALEPILAWIYLILTKTNVIPDRISIFFMYGPTLRFDITYCIVLTILAGTMIFRHRGNIQRLIAGTERKTTDKASK